jgi:hypothetical protein
VTWLVAIVWGVLYWALRRGKTWFYPLALVTSLAGIISGFIPSWILFYEYWQSYGVTGMPFTPSWFRTIINIILLIVLLIPRVRNGVGAHIKETSASVGGSLGSDVSQFAYVFFGFGSILMAYALILPIIHAVWSDVIVFLGIDFGSLLFFSGLLCILLGVITLIAGRVITMVHTSKPSIIKT